MTLFELTQLLKEQRKNNELKEHNKYEHQREVLGQKKRPYQLAGFSRRFYMNNPRLTDNKRNKSRDEAIAYAMEQIEVMKQGKASLSPSIKEKKFAMESHYDRWKKLNDSIIESPINWQSNEPRTSQYADDRGYG